NLSIKAVTSDDVQVRNVELLLNGQVVRNDVSFPFDLSAIAPLRSTEANTATLVVRATDTGGNITMSDPIVLNLVPDTFPPSLVDMDPFDGAYKRPSFSAITLRFSEPIGRTSVSASDVQLVGPGGAVAPTDIQFRSGDRIVQLSYPSLALGQYHIIVSGA